MPSKEFQNLLDQLKVTQLTPRKTIEEQRQSMDAVADQLPPDPSVEITPVHANGTACEWLDWPEFETNNILFFTHGGGFCIGSARTHRDLASRMAKEVGARVLNVDYRLAPEHPFPAAIEDVVQAYEWLLSEGHSPQNVCVAGDSAGGGLTLSLLLALKENSIPLPACAVCMSPLTDNTRSGATFEARTHLDPIVTPETSRENSRNYMGASGDPKDPLASPLFGDLSGLPPIQILVGTAEILFDDSRRFAEKANASGSDVELQIWDDMIHIWPYFAQAIPEGREAISEMARFIRAQWAKLQQEKA